MIRRESRPFTVEVRKGQKRTPQVQTFEQPPSLTQKSSGDSLEDVFRRAEAALFDRSQQPAAAVNERQPETSAGKGRILETLDEVDPVETLLAERTTVTRRGRKPGSKNKPKPVVPASTDMREVPLDVREASFEAGPAALTFTSEPSAAPVATASHGNGPAEAPPLQPRSASHDLPLRAAESPSTEPAPASSPATNFRSRLRGSIRGRYVTGLEPKPGERWKRRLRGGS